jgi:hypothetical protein
MAWERKREIPMAPPIVLPKDREMMKYSPPPSTLRFVAISAMAKAVGTVTMCPNRMMRNAPTRPACPTAYPKRRNMTAPRMVLTLARKTGLVPKP